MREIIDYTKKDIGTEIKDKFGSQFIEHCQTCGRNGLNIPNQSRFEHKIFPDSIDNGYWLIDSCDLLNGYWHNNVSQIPTEEEEKSYADYILAEREKSK